MHTCTCNSLVWQNITVANWDLTTSKDFLLHFPLLAFSPSCSCWNSVWCNQSCCSGRLQDIHLIFRPWYHLPSRCLQTEPFYFLPSISQLLELHAAPVCTGNRWHIWSTFPKQLYHHYHRCYCALFCNWRTFLPGSVRKATTSIAVPFFFIFAVPMVILVVAGCEHCHNHPSNPVSIRTQFMYGNTYARARTSPVNDQRSQQKHLRPKRGNIHMWKRTHNDAQTH